MKTQTIKSDTLGGLQPLVIVTRHPTEVSGIKTFISLAVYEGIHKVKEWPGNSELNSDVNGARYNIAS